MESAGSGHAPVVRAEVTSSAPATAPVDSAGAPPVSFSAVYREHFRFVWRLARSLGVPAARVEDAVQDVFVIVHRRLAEHDGHAPLRAWLFEIVRRVAHDHRRTIRRKETTEPLDEGRGDSEAPDPARLAEASEDLRLVESILANLDEDRRMVFVLAEIEQMTAPEIAESLGINLNTVYSRLRRAREEFHAAAARARGEER
jgi:RNA polymerase sigma-70 factor, ECF subfamily